MANRATVFQGTQLGPESTKGTVVAASKRLLATQFKLTPVNPIDPFSPMGSKAATTVVKQKEMTEGEIEGVLAYNDIVYLLSSALEQAAITTPSGGTLTRKWAFAPLNFAVDDGVSYTIETGTTGGDAERTRYGLIDALTLRWTRESAAVTGSVIAQEMDDGITITPAPTDIAELPVDPDEVSVFVGDSVTNEVTTVDTGSAASGTWTLTVTDPVTGVSATTAPIAFDAIASAVESAIEALANVQEDDVSVTGTDPWTITWAGRYAGSNMTVTADFTGLSGGAPTIVETTAGGLTKLTSCLEAEWAMGDRYTPVFTLDAAEVSFSKEVERSPDLSAQLILEADTAGVAFMTDLRAKTTKFCRIECRGPSIEAGFTNRIALTFPFKFADSPRDDNDDVWAITYNLIPIFETAFASWTKFEVDTALTAL